MASYSSNSPFVVTVPPSTSNAIISPAGIYQSPLTVATPMAQCEYVGHETSAELVEYIDGKVFSTCVNCAQRVAIGRVPGGFNAIRSKELLAVLAVAGNEADLDQYLDEFASLKEGLRLDREALEASESRMRAIERLLMQYGLFGEE